MEASVIIPTYNGAHKIAKLLDSLLVQSKTDFEIIVVVDGSTDDTVDVLRRFQTAFKNLHVIVQENRGRARTRNAGAAIAKTSLFIFYDDDMEVDRESVERHVQFHRKRSSLSIVTGYQNELPGLTDIQRYKSYLTEFWFLRFEQSVTRFDFTNLFFSTANCSIPREIFEQLKGFDEQLTDAEDYDLGYRALKENIPVYFDKSNLSIHRERITCLSYIERQRQYNKAKQKWKIIRQVPLSIEGKSYLKLILYGMFAFRFWVRAIDLELFLFLPRRLRYKLYDVVIQALSVEFPNVKLI